MLPEDIGNWQRLETLRISGTNLREIPDGIGNL